MNARILRLVAACGLVVLAAPAVRAQATKRPVMTPEQRAREQAKLNAQEAELEAAMPLEANKEKLRKDVTPMRDTLVEVSAVVTRMNRARTTKTESVLFSSAKQLRLDCVGAANVGMALQPKLAGLKTADTRANGFLDKYRTSLGELVRSLQACDKKVDAELGAKAPSQAHLTETGGAVQAAIANYTEAQRNLFGMLQIKMLPRGYKPPNS